MTDFFVFNFFPVFAIEILILRLMRWGNLPTCVLDALVMNFASFICLMLGIAPAIEDNRTLGLTLYFTYSWLAESAVLCLLERHSLRKALFTAAAANLVSTIYLAIDAQVLGK